MATIADRVTAASEPPRAPTVRAVRLRRTIHALGAAQITLFGTWTLLSVALARAAPWGRAEPLEAAAYDRLAAALSPVSGALSRLAGPGILDERIAFGLAAALLLAVPALIFAALVTLLARHAAQLDARVEALLFRWAAAFALLLAFAAPVLVQDFWLSAGWGRLVADGVNPYYVHLDPQVTAGLPLDYLGLLMTYGPLWALASGSIMAIAAGPLLAFALFKLLLLAAWIGSLLIVRALLRESSIAERCAGIVIAGWLPLGVVQFVAEGHNDIVMVFLVLLWLIGLERRRSLPASGALAASFLIKYLSAPLFLLDLLWHIRARRKPLWTYAPHAALAALLAGLAFAPFFRSLAFFDSTAHMADWHFFTPRDAVVASARLAGLEPAFGSVGGLLVIATALAVQGFFLLVLVHGILRFWYHPVPADFRRAVVAVTVGMLFGAVGHLWPWFLGWAVLMVALRPTSLLARWTTGVAIAAPLGLLAWVAFPGEGARIAATPPMYAFAIAWMFLMRSRWPVPDSVPARQEALP